MLSGLSSSLAAAAVLVSMSGATMAQSNAPAPAGNGVWFQVKAAIKPDPTSADEGRGEARASLAVQLRISAHADGSNFYGHPAQSFDFKLSDGSAEKLFWQDSACHPRRGLPKITVVAVDGTLERDGKKVDVNARPRTLGMKLPKDELSPGSHLSRGLDGGRQFLAFESRTGSSKLGVLVRIYSVDCAI